MRNLILSAVILFSASSAFAGCYEDFRYLQDKSKVSLKLSREIEVKSKKAIKNLREEELKAVENYISYMNFKFEDDSSLLVKSEQYQTKDKYKSTVGYRVSVSGGGDESTVRYYIKIDFGVVEDGVDAIYYPILFRVWDNQSPERDFLCQTY